MLELKISVIKKLTRLEGTNKVRIRRDKNMKRVKQKKISVERKLP